MKQTLIGSFYLMLASSIWGGMYVVVKVLVEVIPPLELVWIRYLIALIALVTIGLITRQKWQIRRQHYLLLLLISLVGYVTSIVAQDTGTMLSTAQMGAIITATTPSFMVVFASLILKERLTKRKMLSVSLATIGVLAIIGIDDLNVSSMLGGISLVIAALTWALMSVLVKKMPGEYSPIVVTAYATLIAVVVLSPVVLPRLQHIDLERVFNPTILGGLLYLGVISTSLAFLLWSRGLQLLNASSGGVFFFFQPLVGALLGWLLLGETLSVMFWVGAALILIGVFIVITEKPKEEGQTLLSASRKNA